MSFLDLRADLWVGAATKFSARLCVRPGRYSMSKKAVLRIHLNFFEALRGHSILLKLGRLFVETPVGTHVFACCSDDKIRFFT